MLNEQLIKLPTFPNEYLALWKINHENSDPSKNIFLTHGTYSDRRVCMGIASYLVENGHTCWILEWRAHGSSSPTKSDFTFETVAKKEYLIVFDYLFKTLKINSLNCVLHSGGGAMLSMFLVNNPQYIEKINSAVFFGSQAASVGFTFKNRVILHLTSWFTELLGYSPAKIFGRPHDETAYTMRLWYQWNITGVFSGEEQFDYKQYMPKINFPILAFCGANDKFIAPVQACQKFLDAFQNPKNKLVYCSKKNGFLEDYDHGRVLHSSSARKEIWPRALEWIGAQVCNL